MGAGHLEAGKPTHATARTDAKGSATFTLKQPGLWVLNAVVMDQPPEGRTDADWVSTWSSLSFDLAPTPVRDSAGPSRP
jgi:hypothetical protein